MFSLLNKIKKITIFSLASILLLAPFLTFAQNNNDPESGLPNVPDIKINNEQNTGLSSEDWITVNKNGIEYYKSQLTSLNQVKKTLEEELKKSEEKGAIISWGIVKEAMISPGGTIANKTYYKMRSRSISRKIVDVNEKISHLKAAINHCDKEIAKEKEATAKTQEEREVARTELVKIRKEYAENLKEELILVKEGRVIDDASCMPIGGGLNVGNCVVRITGWVGQIITGIIGILLWLTSLLFDLSIYLSIKQAYVWFDFDGIKNSWIALRDFANLFFVFILLYIAIGTIFELRGIGDPKKMITEVVIIALLVNFSGFFVRVVIDSSNIIAYEFYHSMTVDENNVETTISTNLMKHLSLVNLYLTSPKDATSKFGESPKIYQLSFLGVIAQSFGTVFLILVTSFVLIVASILFLIRTVVLMFIYVLSPLAFVSRIIPNPRFNYFDKWLGHLVKQSFFAPGFLIPMYAVLKITESGIASLAGVESNGGMIAGGAMTDLIINLILLGMMISCIFIAQAFGAAGTSLATKAASTVTRAVSRPIGRYGGRLAGGAGKYIAGTGAGKLVASSWNEGRLQRVRQSWDTGVLGDMRRSEIAQGVANAARNPMVAASRGIGAIGRQVGVQGMENIVGTTPFNEQTTARATTSLTEMRQRERPEDQARYLEGLASPGKREEFNAVYDKLSAEERRKIEDKATPALKARLQEQRKKLEGKAAQQTATEIVQNNNTPSVKFDALRHLKEADFKAVYKSLTPQQRVTLRQEAFNDGQTVLVARIDAAQAALPLSAGQQAAANVANLSQQAINRIQNAYTTRPDGSLIQTADVLNVSPTQIVELSPAILTKLNVIKALKIPHLDALRGATTPLADSDRQIIKQELERIYSDAETLSQPPTSTPIPDNIKRVHVWLNGPGSSFA